ncbi:MAG TPA: immunoglobulin domain-containing protein, partial [Candidatus Saccharimonadales bacterium]|nr:immunoglobulin domain-containing protein [Candidatus Saccharimonadales bacterium]
MKRLTLNKSRAYTSLLSIVALMFAMPVLATLTISTANEHGSAPFTPTWTPAAGSLIAGLAPSSTSGNFALDDTNRNPNSLTSGDSLTITTDPGNTGPDPIGNTTTSSNYVACGNGSGAGSAIIYTLPASTYGYNLTNITVDGGWGDNGRDGQAYNVFYSTVSNPTQFIYLTSVSYVPSGVPNSTPSATQVIISDSAGGVIAANVAAVKFDFTFPGSENGWTGYGAITVQGVSATSVITPALVITTTNQNGPSPFTPTYTAEVNNDLILGLSPSTAAGNFQEDDGNNGPISILTDGLLASNVNTAGWEAQFVSCGGGNGAGSTLIYTLPANANGYDITNIVTYSGWQDGGRDGQYYTVSYSTVAAPTTFVPIGTVYYLPSVPSQPSLNRVSISTGSGAPLGSGVQNIKFDFAGPTGASSFNNGWQGYDEIIVQGTNTAAPPPPPSPILSHDILPTYAETVVGDQVVFTADFSNAPPANLQWISIIGGVTNVISGATGPTLTLNDVQTASSGYYQLEAVNATNGAAAPSFSTPAQLVVGNTPTPVGGITVDYAGQCGWGGAGAAGISTNFVPTWTVDTTNDLVLDSADTFVSGPFPGGPGTVNFSGNFALEGGDLIGDPAVLSDGSIGYFSYWPNVGTSPTECSCGVNGAGAYVIYALNTNGSPFGFDLTNITVYGGWGDGGRNEQKYQVLYSTVAAPTNFSALTTVDYNPNNPNNNQSGTRTTLVPGSGVLAHNVFAVEINWNLVGGPPKNGVEGYSEIVIAGTNSVQLPTLVQD